MVGVYDSAGMESPSLEDLKGRKLIVKVFPIHKELMEAHSWLVIGNLPIDKLDEKQPQGPLMISGNNEQLNAANYHYGLPHQNYYRIDELLNR